MSEELNKEEYSELDDSVLVLQDENGEDVEFYLIAEIDYKDEWYAFLQPVELGDMTEDEILIFKIVADENGDDMYEPVEDEEVLNAVYDEYVKLAEEEDDCDCECGDDCECGEGCSCHKED